MKTWVLSICLITCLLAPAVARGQAEVTYSSGLLTVRCDEVPLAQLFEQINAAAGIELILEDSVKTTRLTANIEAQPPHLALERLLAGSGVNYAMSFDPQDWTRVTKIFIGSGGESPAPAPQASSSRTPVRRRPVRRAEPVDDYQDEDQMMEEEEEPVDEEFPEEFDPEAGFETPEAGQPPANTNPRPPSYPRSPFTPGLESNPFGNTNPQSQPGAQPQQEGEADNPPPAYYPFLDPFGRPIPVPPGAQPQQKKKNPQNR